MHVVALVATPGAPIFEMAVPAEVFGIARPELVDPWYQLRVHGSQPGRVPLASGFSIEATEPFATLGTADTIVVPACTNVHADPPRDLVEALVAAHRRGIRIASICSGAFVLAAAGLLDGRRATTHWRHADELRRRHPAVEVDASVLYLQDGLLFTSAGTAAGLDLCLELVRQDHGAAVANRLARRIVIPPHRSGGQAQFVETPLPATADDPISRLTDWALAHLHEPLTLGDLATAGRMSTRTLARRFHAALGESPMQWLLAQRVRRAQELLESTEEPVERVAELVGFGQSASLREHFARTVGVPPSEYRQTFRAGQAGSRGAAPS